MSRILKVIKKLFSRCVAAIVYRHMTQENKSINTHIEKYLDYYCSLSAPGFAVLLKGRWGCGKTWFIKKYTEKLKTQKQKWEHVSLYGMTSFSEIEYVFFEQLNPLLASKGMAITGKILKGLLKGTLKIDLNDDSKDDGTLTLGIPDINLPEYLKDTDKSILIFDDLERCQINIINLLGYINYFVEHQYLKVIIIANEDELLDQCSSNSSDLTNSYKVIKEKLISKTFAVFLDFEGALENFITGVNSPDVSNILSNNVQLIENWYHKAEYENLRSLKQIILDFERIFEILPDKAKNKPEIIKDILKLLVAFSIEIKRGAMLPKDISKLKDNYNYTSESLEREIARKRQTHNSSVKENSEEETSLKKIFDPTFRTSGCSILIFKNLS